MVSFFAFSNDFTNCSYFHFSVSDSFFTNLFSDSFSTNLFLSSLPFPFLFLSPHEPVGFSVGNWMLEEKKRGEKESEHKES